MMPRLSRVGARLDNGMHVTFNEPGLWRKLAEQDKRQEKLDDDLRILMQLQHDQAN